MQKCEKNAVRTQSKVFIKNKTLWRVCLYCRICVNTAHGICRKSVKRKPHFFNAASFLRLTGDMGSNPVNLKRKPHFSMRLLYLGAVSGCRQIFDFEKQIVSLYFAKSKARLSRMMCTLICPGYSSSSSIFLAISRARITILSSLTASGRTIMRTSRPA